MQDIQEMHLNLHEQLQQFEREQEQIGEGIIEGQRRIGILDEAMSWSAVEVGSYQVLPQEYGFVNGAVGGEADQGLPQEHGFVDGNLADQGLPQEDEFQHVDAECTEIQWVNR